jgi:hypothetical protein
MPCYLENTFIYDNMKPEIEPELIEAMRAKLEQEGYGTVIQDGYLTLLGKGGSYKELALLHIETGSLSAADEKSRNAMKRAFSSSVVDKVLKTNKLRSRFVTTNNKDHILLKRK